MKRSMMIASVLATFLLSSLTALGQTQSRSDVLKEIEQKRAELAALEENFLQPGDDDRARYAEFLHQPNTGLIRLLPREKFDSEVYKNNKKTITMRGGGAYYSFVSKSHPYGYGSDISLDKGYLQTGFAGADYGMLADLGGLSIEDVGPETNAVAVFAAYEVPTEEALARSEFRRIQQGAELNGWTVKNRVPMRLNSTYLLRSINYLRSDVLVVFKVVRIDSDGSATLLWKLLKKYDKPKLKSTAVVEIR
ncbi:MAG TPA: hypothetical protein VLB87_15590 [Pyrinomonadaceae bacterium]|nr:hypothetical protein [Pyrinomonadaceae bacterium]